METQERNRQCCSGRSLPLSSRTDSLSGKSLVQQEHHTKSRLFRAPPREERLTDTPGNMSHLTYRFTLGWLCSYLCVFTFTLKMFLETKIHSAFYNWTSLRSARGWSLRQSDIFLNAGSLFCFWNCTSKDQMAQSEYIQERRGSHQRCPETKETTSKSHHAIWTCYRTDGTLNCLILSAEQRKETFLK